MLANVLEGLATHIIFWILLVVATTLVFVARRRTLLGYFGASEERSLIVYCSRIQVVENGSTGVSGNLLGFQGPTVFWLELLEAQAFSRLLDGLFERVSSDIDLLRNVSVRSSNIKIEMAPADETALDLNDSWFAVGSPAYNSVSARIEAMLDSVIRVSEAGIELQGGATYEDNDLYNYGIGVRVQRSWNGPCIHYCAGRSTAGTIGALRYVHKNWRRLAKLRSEDESGSLCIVIRVDRREAENGKVVVVGKPDILQLRLRINDRNLNHTEQGAVSANPLVSPTTALPNAVLDPAASTEEHAEERVPQNQSAGMVPNRDLGGSSANTANSTLIR